MPCDSGLSLDLSSRVPRLSILSMYFPKLKDTAYGIESDEESIDYLKSRLILEHAEFKKLKERCKSWKLLITANPYVNMMDSSVYCKAQVYNQYIDFFIERTDKRLDNYHTIMHEKSIHNEDLHNLLRLLINYVHLGIEFSAYYKQLMESDCYYLPCSNIHVLEETEGVDRYLDEKEEKLRKGCIRLLEEYDNENTSR